MMNIVFTPSSQQHQHLKVICDSINSYCSKAKIYLFTDKIDNKDLIPEGVVVKLINTEDNEMLRSVYFQEGRADIPAFAAYAQFLIPKYFQELDHLMYLEVDQVVRKDFSDIYTSLIEKNVPLGAVHFRDHAFRKTKRHSFSKKNGNQKYFNTGVLFMNISLCNEISFSNNCIAQAKTQVRSNGAHYEYYAQGAINNAFSQQIHEIDRKYNLTGFGHLRGINVSEIERAAILHWTGPKKPWCKDGLYKDLYFNDPGMYQPKDYVADITFLKKIYYDFNYYIKKITGEYE